MFNKKDDSNSNSLGNIDELNALPLDTIPTDSYLYQELDMSELDKVKLDKNDFIDGVNSMSKLAGKIAALTNVGVQPREALNFFALIETNKFTHNIQKIQSDTSVKIAEITGEQNQKNMF